MPDKKIWEMPDWMKQYIPLIGNTGGNDIEELYNDDENHLHSNLVRAILIYSVQSQVDLLLRLQKAHLLCEWYQEEEETDAG